MAQQLEIVNLPLWKRLIEQGMSSVEMATQLNISWPTVHKYVKSKLSQADYEKLIENGRANKVTNRIDGRATFSKYKKSSCEKCGATGRLEMHHIKPAVYKDDWRGYEAGNHNPENLMTLCNSCHQKIHYRELGRKVGPHKDPKTGRWLSGSRI
jgi:5-methylcytosine-specific restriction endonuclease McrA